MGCLPSCRRASPLNFSSKNSELVTWYLQLTHQNQFKPVPFFQEKARVEILSMALGNSDAEVNSWFYHHVGKQWQWHDRADWTSSQWNDYVQTSDVITGVGYLAQDEIGYFELQRQNHGADVELVYFGLLPESVGEGLGAGLLTAAIECAWSLKPERVWVHTCNKDHPHALRNYQSRGFEIYKTETSTQA